VTDLTRDEDVAVVGSPSTNAVLTLDVLLEATAERLVGALLALETAQDGRAMTIIGQTTTISLSNKWHEDSVFRNLLKRTGDIPPITNRQDTRTAEFSVGATFEQGSTGWVPSVLGMVPATGTRVRRVTQLMLDQLLRLYEEEIMFLGRAYGNDVMYPMWLKHFGEGPRGIGEAYHIGLFGKTGSGKSGLAKMLMLAYARHPELGILVIDPQGEFTLEVGGTTVGKQELPVKQVIAELGRPVQVYAISQLLLTGWELFEEMLIHLRFFERVGIPAGSQDNARRAAEVVRTTLERRKHKFAEMDDEKSLDDALTALSDPALVQQIYSTPARANQMIAFIGAMQADSDRLAETMRAWKRVTSLFQMAPGKRQIFGIVRDLLGQGDAVASEAGPRPLVVIDISESGNRGVWFEDLERRILIDLLQALIANSTSSLRTGQSANVLVVLDEAHRHAPNSRSLEGYPQILLSLLRRAARETRKYGIGWMFISQTLGGLDREIVDQMRVHFFGFGLALGEEFRRLKEFAGGDNRAMELYQSFRDPQAFPSKDLREFPFMVTGPISPLSFSGKPVFFTAFTESDRFISVNGLGKQSKARNQRR
jgi:uncharacterized protein DUF87